MFVTFRTKPRGTTQTREAPTRLYLHAASPSRWQRVRARVRSQAGFTLLETLMAAVVLVVGLVGLLGLLDITVKASANTRAREGATSLAREILEDARTIPYAQLSPTSIVGDLQGMTGLANASSGPSWKIVRRGITYTITMKECSLDDPKAAAGAHEGTFCKDPGEKAENENLKRITVEVKWSALGRAPVVKQVSTLTAAGEAIGLSATKLELIEPEKSTAPVITNAATENLTFSVSAPASTTGMSWSLNGTAQTPSPTLNKGTEWRFTWGPIGTLSDGTYQVSAQAINATGVLGPPVTISVQLIRHIPAAPKNIKGGFNKVYKSGVLTEVAELQWQANSELNVIGYRVKRAGEEACPGGGGLSLATSCIDFSPPAIAASEAKRTYSIAALYLDSNGIVQEGTQASFTLSSAPETPNAPTGLKVKKNESGSATLEGSAPSGGPAVAFYRIYRGSRNYTSRYATAFTPPYTDTEASETHEYWVTAVSSTLTESPFSEMASG
jgi:type II secretory pathway pseudopilin PulG